MSKSIEELRDRHLALLVRSALPGRDAEPDECEAIDALTAALDELARLRAEVERMKPVVEAAERVVDDGAVVPVMLASAVNAYRGGGNG